MLKLIKKSAFVKDTTSDSVKDTHKAIGKEKNLPLLELCERVWMGLEPMREQRLRNFRYVFGDQWGDYVEDEHGKRVKERSRIMKRTGGLALQNNHLFKVVNSIVGVYCKSSSQPIVFARQEGADAKSQMMTNALQTNYENNEMKDILMTSMYEMICGGIPILVEEWGSHEGVEDSYTYEVNPQYFFFRNKGTDSRMWDTDLVGEIRDYTLGELAAKISEEDDDFTEDDFKQLEAIYAPYLNDGMDIIDQQDKNDEITFDRPSATNLCRTYHVWTQEYKSRYRVHDPLDQNEPLFRIDKEDAQAVVEINAQRRAEALALGWAEEDIPYMEFVWRGKDGKIRSTTDPKKAKVLTDQYWHFRMLSPQGYVLQEYDSPYEHKGHPYIYTAHHYINGHIYPFIGVVVDQQRYINRLISLHDLAIQNAAKGIKMVPTNVLGGMSPKQFAKQFVEIGGFVFYTPDPKMPNVVPQVVTTNSTNIGTSELLKLEVDWINEISTVSGALQGATPKSGTAASQYAMEMQNSTTSITSTFQRFNSFEMQLAKKKMKTIHQYYNEPRNISLKHSNGYANYSMYEPQAVEDIDFVVSIKQGAETPVARMMVNDLVRELWSSGVFTAKQMLKYGYFEGSEEILQELDAAEEQAAAQGQVAGVSPEMTQQVAAQANPEVASAVQNALMS